MLSTLSHSFSHSQSHSSCHTNLSVYLRVDLVLFLVQFMCLARIGQKASSFVENAAPSQQNTAAYPAVTDVLNIS